MADTLTVTLDLRYPKRVGGNAKYGVISGTANITSYSTAKVPVVPITALFRSVYRVVCDGVSSNGYAMKWDTTQQCFRAFDTGAAAGGALTEAVNATNIGTVNFIVAGLISGAGN